MPRFLSILFLVLLTSCASNSPVSSPQVTTHDDELRLREIYRSAFARGFREAWDGKSVIIDTMGLIGKSTDPEGESALLDGHSDGQRAGRKARIAYETESAEKEEHGK